MLNLALIKQRKAMYGDNFECIAKEWNEKLKKRLGVLPSFRLSGDDVALLMMLMKECRIKAISDRLEVCEQDDVKRLKEALKDSLDDRDNYEWIANNYKKYKRL